MRPIDRRFFRDNFLGLSLTLVGVLCLVLSGISYLNHRQLGRFALASGGGLDGADIEMLERQNKAYERIAESVTPAVVSIQSTSVVKVQQSPFSMDPLFRQFFGDMIPQFNIPRQYREHALGSGVIVSPEGYLLTNNHVIRNASSIDVLLSDKRNFKAKVVGADPQTDLAVLKIDARELPAASLGDSTTLHVGDTVMAFGNPFNLSFTVTRGTVSALGRSQYQIEDIQNFIQTDAAINPGNSGGALVDVRGQVVGINTAILSGNSGPGGEGGSIGIGFAIPINMAKHVMQDLINSGKVTRGYLGVSIYPVTDDFAKEFHAPDTSGAFVQDVTAGSPADKAGVKYGDIIRKLNGQSIADSAQLRVMVTEMNPRTAVTLDILRDGKPMTVRVTLGELPANLAAQGGSRGTSPGPTEGTLKGIEVQNLTPSIRDQLQLPENVKGVVISQIDPNSPAAQVGLQGGDVIESINRQPVSNVIEFNRLAAQAKGRTLLRVNRQGQGQYVLINPSGDDASDNT